MTITLTITYQMPSPLSLLSTIIITTVLRSSSFLATIIILIIITVITVMTIIASINYHHCHFHHHLYHCKLSFSSVLFTIVTIITTITVTTVNMNSNYHYHHCHCHPLLDCWKTGILLLLHECASFPSGLTWLPRLSAELVLWSLSILCISIIFHVLSLLHCLVTKNGWSIKH